MGGVRKGLARQHAVNFIAEVQKGEIHPLTYLGPTELEIAKSESHFTCLGIAESPDSYKFILIIINIIIN